MEFLPLGLMMAASLTMACVHMVGRARRRQRLFQFAFRFGLEYSPVDPFALMDHGFDLFNQADGARCQNVVWGTWHGLPINTGELRFAPSREARQNGQRGKLEQFSFAFVEVAAWLPHLAIRKEVLGGLAEHLGLHRIHLESGAFNRAYHVVCDDREFAYKFIDVRMMQWLMDWALHSPFQFEVSAHRLLVHCPRLDPDGLVRLLGTAKGFHDHVPRMVLREYAPNTSLPG